MFDEVDKIALLKLARATLEARLGQTSGAVPETLSPALQVRKGAFVSLHYGGELRGCIGQIHADGELCETVQHCALSAALEDTRFSPVTIEELGGLEIEISVLSELHRIQSIEEIEVGRHGLYMVQGYHRGLLLPQVATEFGWDRMQFLDHTCLKSGLPKSAWSDPATAIYIFEAEIFSDSKH